ncbi:MAG: DUF192 domain-containing protein [Actinobacteria bacterium]|nr:DUF192 domain-containing protein [Actinomycetota bacterium]
MIVRIAATWGTRTKGLLGLDPCSENGFDVLMLVPCRDIHTYAMMHPIDVAFVNEQGRICKTYRCLKPASHLSCSEAVAVLERFSPSHETDVSGEVPIDATLFVRDSWFHVGDSLALCASSGALARDFFFDDVREENVL